MSTRTVKRTGKPLPEEPLDKIPDDEMARARSRSPATSGKPVVESSRAGEPIPQQPDSTDGSIVGTPARQLLEAQAEQLDAMGWPSVVYGSLAPLFGTGIDKYAYRLFVDSFSAAIGPVGPVERMLAEQLLLSHHTLGHLSVKGMNAAHPDVAKVYLGAAARLMAEFRQTALALKSYRIPTPVPPPASNMAKPPERATSNKDKAVGQSPQWHTELDSRNRLTEVFNELAAELS